MRLCKFVCENGTQCAVAESERGEPPLFPEARQRGSHLELGHKMLKRHLLLDLYTSYLALVPRVPCLPLLLEGFNELIHRGPPPNPFPLHCLHHGLEGLLL